MSGAGDVRVDMEKKNAKRFYKSVTIEESGDGFEVLLDERRLKTPAKAPLNLPNKALAEAIRGEFDAQIDVIEAETMPVFSLAATAIDRVSTQRATLDAELVRFGHNDLISYRCPADEDEVLAARQAEMWGQIQQWMTDRYNVSLLAFDGVMPQSQPTEIKAPLEAAVRRFDDWRYVTLYRATTLTGSLSLGLRFAQGDFTVSDMMAYAFLDDLYQEEKWGADHFAVERRGHIETELKQAHDYLMLLETP